MNAAPDSAPTAPQDAHCDVLVVGGGPAGSTVATLLAERGHRVVVLDKDRHPRFHIGESLLPANLPLFERLGLAEEMRAIGMHKPGAEFVSPHHEHTQTFVFADAWDKSMPHAYQVKRAEFDELLLTNAARRGAEVHQGSRATAVEFTPDGGVQVDAKHGDGTLKRWHARFLIDASGRDTFLANRFRIKERNPQHTSAAVYAHFSHARRHEGLAEGNISIFWFEHGWFWFIPMSADTTSVGMVTWPHHMKSRAGRSLEQFLADNIAACPALAERLAQAQRITEVEATGNFSYSASRNHGSNYLMLGDAYAFVDPVFSSGVWLAMNSGVVGAETVDACLRRPAESAAALRRFDRVMRHGPRQFSWFIYRMTNPIMRDFFMYPKNVFRMQEALLSMLAGDIFGKTPIWRSIWMFKALYYTANVLQPRRAWAARQKRRWNIRPVDDAARTPA
ncbi:Dehydrogenase (flavoprotein) [Oryzisolibacter propanilivorax]|uniref:Dehydrogenase (Flavoprotein) n=1 Tax=Oryzisolibacter propanilivorax TaxID=1527607 RepID=A0A1G9QFN2_9BURK|nr:NAD(P)/FAD-dependent oxidoreductase [Oryzisolibacter propanilivorax]SDM09828.1 Dehydrogenase (flavoprotein) [Oryzisolibacter propanilivorax]